MHRETRIANIILAAFSSVALVLMSLPLSRPVVSLKAALSYAFNPVAYYGSRDVERLTNVPANLRHLFVAEVRNQELIEEMRRWTLVEAEAQSLRLENGRLREALGLKPAIASRTALWAHVMERDPSHWYHSVTVDAGEDEGVALNAPVLGRKGESLVALGRVTEIGPNYSKVLLLTDELSSVAAYLSSGPVEGLVQGQGGENLRMNYLHSDAVLFEGDLVYTSPTGATFPPDILIGRVARVNPRDAFLTFQSVEVKPVADASSFSEVIILKAAP